MSAVATAPKRTVRTRTVRPQMESPKQSANNALDYYKFLDGLYSPKSLIRDTVRSFVDDEVLPIIEEHYRRNLPETPRQAHGGTWRVRYHTSA